MQTKNLIPKWLELLEIFYWHALVKNPIKLLPVFTFILFVFTEHVKNLTKCKLLILLTYVLVKKIDLALMLRLIAIDLCIWLLTLFMLSALFCSKLAWLYDWLRPNRSPSSRTDATIGPRRTNYCCNLQFTLPLWLTVLL